MASYPSVNSANKYARDVVTGKIPACDYVRRACQLHLNDLAASKKRGFKWRFDKDAAERVCEFIELLPHAKGKWAAQRELIELQPWQLFIFCCVFGWVSKRTGLRRYREVYIEVPRKNGKSVLAAGVGLYMLCLDGEYGAEVYCGATTERQAWEVFRPARQMVRRTPLLIEAFGIQVSAKNLSVVEDESKFEPLIGDPGDGQSPSCALVDEYHEHPSPALYDTMLTGMGAREQPLMFAITTAGFNIAGPCYIQRAQVVDKLTGTVPNDELFGIIYTIDTDDDWKDPKVLRKANPNFGISVGAEYLEKRQADAVRYPSRQNAFKTKHLNIWVSAKQAWLNLADWEACGDPALTLESLRGKPCWLGVDLASKSDIAAVALVFRDKIETAAGRLVDRWTVFCRSYLPEGAIERADANQNAYQTWANADQLIITDGEEMDFDLIRDDIAELAEQFDVQEIAYDKWRATQLAHQLLKDGANVIEVGGGIATMNMPMRELEAALLSRRFRHGNDPVLTWMAGNVVTRPYKGCLTPMKADEGKTDLRKIDGMVAILMAISRALMADGVAPSVLSTLEDDDILVM
ncbi:terminase large subunit [Pseudomonas nitroreducens]|uniref:terminase large subunit n=1 Tax=Pseudomonas nitroreducens TaxID=46680 RepID=UPI002658E7E9|nr:terminase TerL endonuclease subunit [Pseudomonas nitroreducens]MCP1652753.1 phage terminase large subunit-like protein [Pseudomonas nitroreducens]